jgi:hypothetical protein
MMQAVRCGTPVLTSRIAGSIGMLGTNYVGYFDCGQTNRLVVLLRRCRADPAFYAYLEAQCAVRVPLFSTQTERRLRDQLVNDLLG